MPALLLLLTCTALGQGPTPPRPHLLKLFRPSAPAERAAGRDCLTRRDFDGAIRHFDQALLAEPNDVATLLDRARARTDKDGDDDTTAILADLSRAIELEPKNATAWARRGAVRRDESDQPRRDADLAEALRLDPQNLEALTNRGDAFLERDDLDHALADYDAAARLGARDRDLFEGRAIIRLIRRDPSGALADIDAATRVESPRPGEEINLAYLRAAAHLAAGQYDRALGDLDAMLGSAPGNPETQTFRVKTLAVLGRYPEARAILDGLIRAHPGNATILHERAILHRQGGDLAAALADIEAAIKLQPNAPALVVSRAVTETRQHQYARALADYRRVLAWDPNWLSVADKAHALMGLAWVASTCPDARFRDGPKALAAATHACELTEWKDAGCLEDLAAAHAEAGHFARAIELAEAARRIPAPYPVIQQVTGASGTISFRLDFPPANQARNRQIGDEALAGYRKQQPYRDTR